MSEAPSRPKVLMIAGADFTNAYICRFTTALKTVSEYRVSTLAFGEQIGRRYDADASALFDQYHRLPALPNAGHTPFRTAVAALAAISRAPGLWEATYKARIIENLKWRQMKQHLPALLAGYDLYHWHCFAPECLRALELFPPGSRVIISLWGSDLYRTAGLDDSVRQLKACGKATLFTVGSLEMREAFLTKFGRQWTDRMRLVNYGAENLELIDKTRGQRDRFLADIGLDSRRIVVCVGVGSGHFGQHVPVLHEIRKMDPAILNRIALIVPMTYSANDSYKAAVESVLRSLPVPSRLIDRYMPACDAARMWGSCDVLVNVLISDQFNAAMCEALYAGTVLITGAWLPYSRLRLNGIHYHEIERVEQIGDLLSSVVGNIVVEKQRAGQTAPRMHDIMAWSSVLPKWIDIYNEALGIAPGKNGGN
jgi:hypothetical protein